MSCRKSHLLNHPSLKASGSIQWPSFTGTAQLVGTSPSGKVTVYVDFSIGTPGQKNAQDLLADADRIVAANDGLFGTVGGPVNVIVFALGGATDGTGGADHMGCDYQTGQNIEVCAAFGNSERVSALFEAELSECSMGGNLCGLSTGEALSRWTTMATNPGALADFASAPSWVQAGYPNWVDQTQPSDQDYPSIGCGMAFLSWLQSLGYPLSKIAPAMVGLGDSGTLRRLYQTLSNPVADPWPTFLAAVKALPGGVKDDDPFKGSTPPPNPPPVPPPAPPPSKVLTRAGVKKAFQEQEAGHRGWALILKQVQPLIDEQLAKDGYQ